MKEVCDLALFNRNKGGASAIEAEVPRQARPNSKKKAKGRPTKGKGKSKAKGKKRPMTEKEKKRRQKERARILKKQQKETAKRKRNAKSHRKRNKKNTNQSELEGQLGDSSMSDPRLSRLAAEPDFWEKMAEDHVYAMLRDMGNSEPNIQKFQKNRFFQSMLIAVVTLLIGLFMGQNLVMLASPAVGFLIYKMKVSSIKGMYGQWKFERELEFSRFVRLLIPYLKQSGGDVSLYTVFNKMLGRMDSEEDRNSLYMLMGEMSSRPGDMRPFSDYADRSSGSDMAHLIMSTVYDFQQSTQDTTVIDELGKMASDHMMDAIDQIIAMKIKRFGMFPTKIVMSSFILVIGFAAGVLLEAVMDLMSTTDMGNLFGG